MLAEFLTPIRANPQHLYQSALPQLPRAPLLQQRYLQSHNPAQHIFGDPLLTKSEDLYWKVDCEKGEQILTALLSPTNINILVARWNTALNCGSLDLRRMDDGSLIQTYATRHNWGIRIGFLSGNGDVVVSWRDDDSECLVYGSDTSPFSVMDKMGWRRNLNLRPIMIAVTENTLAWAKACAPNRPCLINTTTWTEATLPVPAALSSGPDTPGYYMTQLAFAPDSTSLIAIYGYGTICCHVLVWNWRTRDLMTVAAFPLAPATNLIASRARPTLLSPTPWELYLFPKSDYAVFVRFESLRIHLFGDAVMKIPLAGAPLQHGANPNSSISGSTRKLQCRFEAAKIQVYDTSHPLPHYDRIGRLSVPLVHPRSKARAFITMVEDQLATVRLGAVSRSDESCLLSSTADVIVRVGATTLRAGSACHSTAVSEGSNQKSILSSTLSQNGRFLACGCEHGLLEVYDLDSGSHSTPEHFFLGLACYHPVFLAFVLGDTHIAVWGERPQEKLHGSDIRHRILSVQLVKLSKDSQPSTKIGEVRWRPLSQEEKVHLPVISSALSMSIELEWTGDDAPRPILTKFGPGFSYQVPLSFQPVDPSADYLRAFSPNNRFVGVSCLETSWVWSTSTEDLIYSVKGGLFGINHVPAILRVLLSSPFPDPSQITYYAADPFRNSADPPPPSTPPNDGADTAVMNWDSAVFVMIHESDKARDADEYHRARISWRSNGFMVANAKTGYIRLDNGRLCWAHDSFHSSFHSPFHSSFHSSFHSLFPSDCSDPPSDWPLAWVEKGGSRILLGGRNGVRPVVLDVGGASARG